MKYLKDKHGIIWGIILVVGVVLVGLRINFWLSGMGGLMIGLSYGSVWARSLNFRERR